MTVTKTIYFEQPSNEHIRVCLRLEFLFEKIRLYNEGESAWNSRIMLESLLEAVNIIERSDLKNILIKELSRLSGSLTRLNDAPKVDSDKLKSVMIEIKTLNDALINSPTKLLSVLRDNEFLNTVRQHLSNPGGACNFDNPALHCWLENAYDVRKKYLDNWLGDIEIIRNTVNLILRLIRESTEPTLQTATKGFFQISLDPKNPCQLISVGLALESNVYPEISLGPHRLYIRFLEPNFPERAQHSDGEICFKLKCCAI